MLLIFPNDFRLLPQRPLSPLPGRVLPGGSDADIGQAAAPLLPPGVARRVVVGGPAEGLPLGVGLDPVAPRLPAVVVGVAAREQPQRRVVEFRDGEPEPRDL